MHLNGSDSLGILRQPFGSISCRKYASKINVGMSRIFFCLVIVNFLGFLEISGVNLDTLDK